MRAKTTSEAPTSVLALKRPPTHPGEMLLEECLEPAGLTQVEAAWRMAMPVNRLNEVVRGKRGVTADTALRLARLLDTSAEMWLALGKPPTASVSPPEWPRRACRRHVTATCGIIPIPVLRQGSTHPRIRCLASSFHAPSGTRVHRASWSPRYWSACSVRQPSPRRNLSRHRENWARCPCPADAGRSPSLACRRISSVPQRCGW